MLPWKLGFIDHDAPPEAGGEKTVNGLTSPTCLTSPPVSHHSPV